MAIRILYGPIKTAEEVPRAHDMIVLYRENLDEFFGTYTFTIHLHLHLSKQVFEQCASSCAN